jgi:hypothetical protein
MSDLTADDRKALVFAKQALLLAMREEWQQAAATVQQLSDEFGSDGVDIALIAWCDTARAHLGLGDDKPIRLMFHNAETGEIGTADQVPAEKAWAGRLITARMAMDRETFTALLAAVPNDPKAIGDHVFAVLVGVALTLTTPQPELP